MSEQPTNDPMFCPQCGRCITDRTRTCGWPAGCVLAGLASASSPRPAGEHMSVPSGRRVEIDGIIIEGPEA
jgi:hypothetical protein